MSERQLGFLFSTLLHAVLIALAVFGLPEFLSPRKPPEPQAFTVEIVPITSVSNIRPSEQKPALKEKPEEKKPEAKKSTPPTKSEPPKPQPKPPEPKPPEPKPEEKAELPKPDEKKPDEKKPEEKKPDEDKPKPKPKEPKQDFDALLKSMKQEAPKEEAEKPDKKTEEESSPAKSRSTDFDPGQPLSLSEMDAIRSQIAQCWSVPAGAKDAQNLVVVLRIQLAQDGTVVQVTPTSETLSRAGGDSFYRAAMDSALRAVQICSPLKNLPPDKYNTWRDIEMTFDPKEMLL